MEDRLLPNVIENDNIWEFYLVQLNNIKRKYSTIEANATTYDAPHYLESSNWTKAWKNDLLFYLTELAWEMLQIDRLLCKYL